MFVEESLVTQEMIDTIHDVSTPEKEVKLVVISSIESSRYNQEENVIVLHKPVTIYAVSSVLQNMNMETERLDAKTDVIDFVLPEIHALVVDDNEVNLTVAEGLLEPFNMKLDTANSGMKALEKVAATPYDIIFMDHMMPEMDGIETTHMIRAYNKRYEDVPIIALTANAVPGSKETYLQEGLNDFVAKPIELSAIIEILKKWIPADKIRPLSAEEMSKTESVDVESGIAGIAFLDTDYALSLLKSEKLFWKVLKDYYSMIDRKLEKIKQCEVDEEIGTYIVEVHALKSSSKQIGALSLSKKAEYLEMVGNRHNIEEIHAMTDEMLSEYRNLRNALAPYFAEENKEEETASDAVEVDVENIKSLIASMKEALDELDMDKVEETLTDKKQFRAEDQERVEKLKQLLWDMDIDGCTVILEEWESSL